jgi:glycosyltransferase involved in cell wall biosynthesis
MKILLYSYSFYPNIGGVEDVGHAFASLWSKLGSEVIVVTETESASERPVNYQIYRKPSLAQLAKLVSQSDIVFTSGTTPRLFPLSLLFHKPFVWAHHGYQLSCIDGAGWAEGKLAPMTPWASVCWHARLYGIPKAIEGGGKLYLRRLVAHMVSANIATSKHVNKRQPLPRQQVIYNPFDLSSFAVVDQAMAAQKVNDSKHTFTYIGRLVSEKGVDDLLHAFTEVCSSEQGKAGNFTLQIIGDGVERANLESLAAKLSIADRTFFAGSKQGDALNAAIGESGICIIPSAWEEPGALTVLILLAQGKPLIVSARGWLSECAYPACLAFPNGDRQELASAMLKLAGDQGLQIVLSHKALERVKDFAPEKFASAYLELFAKLVHG